MSRETVIVRVPEFPGTRNRDKDKLYRITEWDSARAENWGLRMMFAANNGAGQLPLDWSGIGMEGIAILGINTFLRGTSDPGTMIPLLDELLQCVKIVRDPKNPHMAFDLVSEDDIAEVATRMWLRGEVLTLHLNFSVSAAVSALYKKIMMKPPPDSSDRSTSQPESTS
jgi:hypothetical protein